MCICVYECIYSLSSSLSICPLSLSLTLILSISLSETPAQTLKRFTNAVCEGGQVHINNSSFPTYLPPSLRPSLPPFIVLLTLPTHKSPRRRPSTAPALLHALRTHLL